MSLEVILVLDSVLRCFVSTEGISLSHRLSFRKSCLESIHTTSFFSLGHFGAGIGSFFVFLRSLVWINFILLTFITIFVIAPQVSCYVNFPNLW